MLSNEPICLLILFFPGITVTFDDLVAFLSILDGIGFVVFPYPGINSGGDLCDVAALLVKDVKDILTLFFSFFVGSND